MKNFISFLIVILLAFVSFDSTASALHENDFSFSVDHSPGEFVNLENSLQFLTLESESVQLYPDAINERQYNINKVSFIKTNYLIYSGLVYDKMKGCSGVGKEYVSNLIIPTKILSQKNKNKIVVPKAKYVIVYGLRYSKS